MVAWIHVLAGYFGNKERKCCCTPQQVQNYRNRISGPLLDRIDIHVEVPNIKFEDLSNSKEETSKQIKNRVNNARIVQKERYLKYGIYTNSELTPKLLEEFCQLLPSSKSILEKYFIRNKLSARSYAKILKLARTIADLEGNKSIQDTHILEALRYRSFDKR